MVRIFHQVLSQKPCFRGIFKRKTRNEFCPQTLWSKTCQKFCQWLLKLPGVRIGSSVQQAAPYLKKTYEWKSKGLWSLRLWKLIVQDLQGISTKYFFNFIFLNNCLISSIKTATAWSLFVKHKDKKYNRLFDPLESWYSEKPKKCSNYWYILTFTL